MIFEVKNTEINIVDIIKIWRECVPKINVILSFIVGFIVCYGLGIIMEKMNSKMYLGIGALIAGINAAYVWRNYKEIYQKIRSSHHD